MPESKNEVKGFFLHFSQCDALFNLPPGSVVNALKLCRDYCEGKKTECDDPIAVCAFGLMRPALDVSMKRAVSGSKGGKANNKQIEANESKLKQNEANGKQNEAKEQIKKNKEQDINNNYSLCAEQAHAQQSAPAVIGFPLNTGEIYNITQADIDHWREIYPGVEILTELRRMLGWLETHPRQRKTRSGIGKFVNGWLDKAQNRSRPQGASPEAQSRKSWAELDEERSRAEFLRMTGGANG